MGLLDAILGKNKVPTVISILPAAAKQEIEAGRLPILHTDNLFLKKGEKIQLVGFGTFEVSERAERTGINPQTKKQIKIAASKSPKFKAGRGLKDAVNA